MSGILNVLLANPGPWEATGGTVTIAGGYKIHTFTSNGTFRITGGGSKVLDYVVVGGGGMGGPILTGTGGTIGGGGGAGGVVVGSIASGLGFGAYSITVGKGGTFADAININERATPGGNSMFGNIITAFGGGGGAYLRDSDVYVDTSNVEPRGSGGGASARVVGPVASPGIGTPGQGYAGGGVFVGNEVVEGYWSIIGTGGGGGAGGVGGVGSIIGDGYPNSNTPDGFEAASGGPGIALSGWGDIDSVAAGGGGWARKYNPADLQDIWKEKQGSHGNGTGSPRINRGDGGSVSGEDGTAGIVLIRYLI